MRMMLGVLTVVSTVCLASCAADAGLSASNEPSGSTQSVGSSGGGICQLEYNSALEQDGYQGCCKVEGQPSSCDVSARCNGLSGSDCCLIYATQHTAGGSGCCLYEDGSFGRSGSGSDRERECRSLLSSSP